MDRVRLWAMVQAARTASRDHVSRQLELAAARRGDLPPPELVGYRRMQLLAARLGHLPMSEVVGDRWLQQPVEGRLGDLDLRLTEVISLRQVEDTLWGFREWLVEQGRQVYEAAIADPDSLADNPELDDSLPWAQQLRSGMMRLRPP